MGDLKAQAEQVHDSDAMDGAVRAGFVVYGVIHLVLAWLALQVAFGHDQSKASSTGAVQTLAREPFGGFLVWVVAVGMILLAAWRLLEAWVGHEDDDGAAKWRKRAGSVGKAVVYGSIGWSALTVAVGAGSSGKQGKKGGTDSMTARLLDLPGGQAIVLIVGLAIIGYGANLARRGWTEKFLEHLDAGGRSSEASTFYRLAGKIGHIAKGAALALVGVLFGYAALTHDADKSGGLDQALQQVAQEPFGQLLLTLIAAGIACYGVFCFARARHLSR